MTIPFDQINLVAVLVAAVISFIFGMAWYSFLRTPWMKASGMTEADIKGTDMRKSFSMAVVGVVVLSYSMSVILLLFRAGTMGEVVTISFFTWLAAVFPLHMSRMAWEQKPWQLAVINGAYELINLQLVSVAIFLWS